MTFIRKSKRGRIALKIYSQWHLVPCETFSVVLDNTRRIRDKIQIVYKEMTLDGVKSYEAK